MKPYTEELRRSADFDGKCMNVTLSNHLIAALQHYGIESRRGGGNFSAVTEIALGVLVALLDNPQMAVDELLKLVNHETEKWSGEVQELAENCLELGKRLYETIE